MGTGPGQHPDRLTMELKFILEALLFAAQKPLSLKELRDVFAGAVEHAEGDEIVRGFRKVKESELESALQQLAVEHDGSSPIARLEPSVERHLLPDVWRLGSDRAVARPMRPQARSDDNYCAAGKFQGTPAMRPSDSCTNGHHAHLLTVRQNRLPTRTYFATTSTTTVVSDFTSHWPCW